MQLIEWYATYLELLMLRLPFSSFSIFLYSLTASSSLFVLLFVAMSGLQFLSAAKMKKDD